MSVARAKAVYARAAAEWLRSQKGMMVGEHRTALLEDVAEFLDGLVADFEWVAGTVDRLAQPDEHFPGNPSCVCGCREYGGAEVTD